MSKCGAQKKTGGTCNQPAGWGTDHAGEGRCKLHGGASTGAPKGNQNARKHGGYSIVLNALSEDEQDSWGEIDTEADAQLDGEIRLLTIREARILQAMSSPEAKSHGLDALDKALTRVQNAKARMIEARHRVTTEREQDYGQIDEFFKAIDSDEDTYSSE